MGFASLHQHHGQIDQAIKLYQSILDDYPDDGQALQPLTELYQSEKRWADYVALSDQILTTMPEAEQTAWYLGLAGNAGVAAGCGPFGFASILLIA